MTKFRNNGHIPAMGFLRGFLALVIASFLLGACSPGTPTAATRTPELRMPATATQIPTVAPSPTPLPGRVLFIAPPGSADPILQALIAEQAGQAGLLFETAADVQPGALTADVRIAVLLAPPPNLNELLLAAPQTQFLVVAGEDLPPAANLSVIRQRPENQVFLGGFISVLLSTDWRAAGLIPSDGPLGAGLQDAFTNGGRYFCGVCAPGWPLGVYYPQPAALPVAADGPSWQAAAANLYDNQKVEVFYLASESLRPEVIQYLQGKNQFDQLVLLVGTQPPPEELRAQWAATIRFDISTAVRQLWPELVAGKGGTTVDAALTVEDINVENMGVGRMRLVDNLLDEMKAGRIYPFTVPQE